MKVAEDESDAFRLALLFKNEVQLWDPVGGYQGAERVFKNPGGTSGVWTFDILGDRMLMTSGHTAQYCKEVSEFHIIDLKTNKVQASHKFANMESFTCGVLTADETKALIGIHRDAENIVQCDIERGFISQRWKNPQGQINRQLVRDPLDPNLFLNLTLSRKIHIWDARGKGDAPVRSIDSTTSVDQYLIANRIVKPRYGWTPNAFYTGSPKDLCVYDIGTGKAIKKISNGDGPLFRGIAASGNAIVCSCEKNEMLCWDLNENNPKDEPTQKINCESGHVLAMNSHDVFIHGGGCRFYHAIYD